MAYKVVKVSRNDAGMTFRVSKGFRLFGVWFRTDKEPLVQKIIIPLDESASNRYMNVTDESTRSAILKAIEHFNVTEAKHES